MKKIWVILVILWPILPLKSTENPLVSLETFFTKDTVRTDSPFIFEPINVSITKNLELEDICRLSGVSQFFNQNINRKKLLQDGVFLLCDKIKNKSIKLKEITQIQGNLIKDNKFFKSKLIETKKNVDQIKKQRDTLEKMYENLSNQYREYQKELKRVEKEQNEQNDNCKSLSLVSKPKDQKYVLKSKVSKFR